MGNARVRQEKMVTIVYDAIHQLINSPLWKGDYVDQALHIGLSEELRDACFVEIAKQYPYTAGGKSLWDLLWLGLYYRLEYIRLYPENKELLKREAICILEVLAIHSIM